MIMFDEYSNQLVRTKSRSTARMYIHYARMFCEWVDSNHTELDSVALQNWAYWLFDQGFSKNSLGVATAAVVHYGKFLKVHKQISELLIKPDLPGVRYSAGLALEEETLRAYCQICETCAQPYCTVMLLLPLTGMRSNEMCTLRLKDVMNVGDRTIFSISSLNSKNKLARHVPLLNLGVEYLTAYLKGYRQTVGGPWLFPSITNPHKHIDTSTIRKQMRKVRNALGLAELTPHTLRHTYVTLLNKYGISPLMIAAIVGHKHIATTGIYNNPSGQSMSDVVDKIIF